MIGYSCRSCRRPLQAVDGCAICQDAKKLIVITGEDAPSLVETANEMVSSLRVQLKDYDRQLRDPKSKLTVEDRELIRAAVRQVGNTMGKLLDSARKLREDNARVVDKMSIDEQRQLFLTWYTDLPPATRQGVYAALAQVESELNTATGTWRNILAEDNAH